MRDDDMQVGKLTLFLAHERAQETIYKNYIYMQRTYMFIAACSHSQKLERAKMARLRRFKKSLGGQGDSKKPHHSSLVTSRTRRFSGKQRQTRRRRKQHNP
eukprot:GEMP01115117.1.p1 GENE.GEMP01115117.1~~GEMP01115117.1.p1  ORF type:complete len:101 (+),score=13.62 GEMP01115117.1:140-442(+)